MSRRSVISAALAALAVGLMGWIMIGVPANAGTLTGTFYADPNSSVKRWLAANPNDSRASLIAARIGSQPQGRWFSNYSPSTVQADVTAYVNAANSANQIPLLIPYMIPNRDCGGASAGGAPTYEAYNSWARSFAAGLGNRTVVVLLEPDSLALQTCLSPSERATRNASLSSAITAMKSVNPNVKVYLDAGHSAWNSAADTANRLRDAGVANSAGFYTNLSNYRWTADEINFGRNVVNALGNTNLHQVIDTSRNGRGPLGSEWCDPAGRGTGLNPTTNTGEATVDAFVWAKPPGEADGCRASAGQFVPDLAYELAQNGIGPTSSPTVSPTASRSPTPSPSISPSRSPSASPTPSPSVSNPGGGCSVAYRIDSQWPQGFTATVTITNRGPAINGWTLNFTFPGNQSITNSWNVRPTQSGNQVTALDGGWNASIPTNGTAGFGFQATYSGTNAPPTGFRLNGVACS
ncbi:glycoside hydrolase family 6 protein [Allorhizocola rhizosphaerae]|uniref:glycoside hydrolase family 6 protein n=1 Tax=Allorhizocola rhizosphaerae TaxID=1872709 RepID=UPI001FEBF1EC|nr:glycoside hydrolase family 6 protein [Allorhizocola rhizosphaerae]